MKPFLVLILMIGTIFVLPEQSFAQG